jgi:hypothetical protein
MPIISLFFGIVTKMYHDDNPPPHFHASYQGFEAFISIATGEIIAGSLPKRRPASCINGRWTIGANSWQTGNAAKRCCPWR